MPSPSGVQRQGVRNKVAGSGAGDERLGEAAGILRALSHPTRLRIVELLSEGEFCVKRLEELLGIPQPSVSQHLSRLRYAGLIDSQRRGHLVCYRLTEPRGSEILRAVLGDAALGGGPGR